MPISKQWPSGGTNPVVTSYNIPLNNELNWTQLSSFLQALADSAQGTSFQKFAARVGVTSPIAISATTDCVVVSNLTVAGPVAVTLPAGAAKQVFIIVDGKGDAGTNNITITPNGAETIRGAATLVLANNYTGVILVFTGTNWDVFGPFIAPGQVTPADFVGILPTTKGGTGVNGTATFPTSGTVAVVPAAGVVKSNGTVLSAGNVDLTTEVTGTLPVANGGTGITSLGAGVATWLGTPSSANLASAVTDETGTGSLVFANTPTLIAPLLGTPTSGVATNLTGLPLTTGVTGTLPIGNGGTGQTTATLAFDALSPLTTKGDLVSNDGTNDVRVAVGANGTVLTADSAEASGVKWGSSAVTPAAGSVYSDGAALQTTGSFAAQGNKVVGVNSGATATEYKSLNTGSSGTDFAIAHAAGSVTFNLPDASAANRGAVTTGAQTFAGVKSFNSPPFINDASSIVQATASVPGVVSTGAQTFGGTKTFSDVAVYGTSPTTNRVSIAQTSTDQTNIPNNASNSYGVYIANGLTSSPGNNATFRGVEVASHTSGTALRMHKPGTVEYNMGINSSNEMELGNSTPDLAGTSRGKIDSSGNLTITSVTATAVIKSFTGSITSLGNGATAGFGLTLDNDQVWQISATTTSGDWCCGLAVRCGNFNYIYALGATNLSLNAATTPTISNTSGGTRNVDVTAIRLK
jgi:hypothetical protein